MNENVLKQEIEMKTREWKAEYDEYDVLKYQAEKKLLEAEASASKIASLMKRLDLVKHKTYYGTLTIDKGVLKVSGHSATYEVPTPKKKPKAEDTQPVL